MIGFSSFNTTRETGQAAQACIEKIQALAINPTRNALRRSTP